MWTKASWRHEEVCDNYVLKTTDAPSYGRTLLVLARLLDAPRAMPGTIGLFTPRWKLEHRVAGLLDEQRNRVTRLSKLGRTWISAVSLALAVTAAFGTISLAEPQQISDEVPKEQDRPATQEPKETKSNDSKPTATVNDAPEVPMRSVAVRVCDPDGNPVRSAEISPTGLRTRLDPASHSSWGEHVYGLMPKVRTNANGIARVPYPQFVRERSETGTLTLSIAHPDHVMFREDRKLQEQPVRVTLKRGLTPQGIGGGCDHRSTRQDRSVRHASRLAGRQ